MHPLIETRHERIRELCRRYHVQRLSIFGSSVRDDFDLDRSDVDLLVSFEPLSELQYAPNYFGLLGDLGCLLGRPVDLIAEQSIRNPYFRDAVDAEEQILYAA